MWSFVSRIKHYLKKLFTEALIILFNLTINIAVIEVKERSTIGKVVHHWQSEVHNKICFDLAEGTNINRSNKSRSTI